MKIRERYIGTISLIVILLVSLYFAKPFTQKEEVLDTTPVCTQDVKQCSDGSYVSRTAPRCEFTECPKGIQQSKATAPEKVVTITYTATGFEPKNVRVSQGTTVEFVNKSNTSFWPASNDHPTHTLYPEFDAKTEIAPGNKYIFTFDRLGTWKYHNHVRPMIGGLVEVN